MNANTNTQAQTTYCQVCGLPLTDVESIERGIGPECLKDTKAYQLAQEFHKVREAISATAFGMFTAHKIDLKLSQFKVIEETGVVFLLCKAEDRAFVLQRLNRLLKYAQLSILEDGTIMKNGKAIVCQEVKKAEQPVKQMQDGGLWDTYYERVGYKRESTSTAHAIRVKYHNQ